MKLIRSLVIIFILGGYVNTYATSENDEEEDWRNVSIDSMKNYVSTCISLPEVVDMKVGSHSLNLDNSGEWVPTGTRVEKDKLIAAKWSTKGVEPRPRKYKVLYRIDPRFSEPQLFIQQYNYDNTGTIKYNSDFHQFDSGALLDYQRTPEMDFQSRINQFEEYFASARKNRISVQKGDVVNITIDEDNNYWNSSSEMTNELSSVRDELSLIYTESPIEDNKIIYSNIPKWCDKFSNNCSNDGLSYLDTGTNWKTLQGRMSNSDLTNHGLSRCVSGANGSNNNLCYYDNSRGVVIKLGGTTIKSVDKEFTRFSNDGKSFFYHQSDVEGDLNFTTDWNIDKMYSASMSQYMKDWHDLETYSAFGSAMANIKNEFSMNFMHFGRYLFDVEIGSPTQVIPQEDLDAIKVEYMIMSGVGNSPDQSTEGIEIDKSYRGNASKSGYLWLKVTRPDAMTGVIKVETENYTGSTLFSDVIYGELVQPLRNKFNELTYVMYINLSTNPTLQNIARLMMVLYISLYGLLFLAGSVKITVEDIVTRVVKIAIIIALFSETSWTFFSQNLFNLFVDGADSLMSSVIGNTSSVGNVFGFIDPVINKYANTDIWKLLFIQFLQVFNGLTFFAIMTIYALLLYFRGLLEVIVGYCLAFLGLAVMISIAPLFIILILFERTRSIFDNWISVMFQYMIQPTILLIFFLLIDQIITSQISQAVVESCWGDLIDINISLDTKHLKLPMGINFKIPGLPSIPFYIPNMVDDVFGAQGTLMKIATSSLILFTLCKLIKGLTDYVVLLVEMLTNVQAARQNGGLQGSNNPIEAITSPITSRMDKVTDGVDRVGARVRNSAARGAARVGAGVTKGVVRAGVGVTKGVVGAGVGVTKGVVKGSSKVVKGVPGAVARTLYRKK